MSEKNKKNKNQNVASVYSDDNSAYGAATPQSITARGMRHPGGRFMGTKSLK